MVSEQRDMATFAVGDCVRIGEGADPSIVGMQGTWQGSPSSIEGIPGAQPLSEPFSFCWVAIPERGVMMVESAFVGPCPPSDDLVAS